MLENQSLLTVNQHISPLYNECTLWQTMSMSELVGSGEQSLEGLTQEGLELARSGDYSERYQDILHMVRDGSFGMIASPEGLALKALYHQSREGRGSAIEREYGALDDLANTYDGMLYVSATPPTPPQATPVVVESLALLLGRASNSVEQRKIADALVAVATRVRAAGYTPGK